MAAAIDAFSILGRATRCGDGVAGRASEGAGRGLGLTDSGRGPRSPIRCARASGAVGRAPTRPGSVEPLGKSGPGPRSGGAVLIVELAVEDPGPAVYAAAAGHGVVPVEQLEPAFRVLEQEVHA